MALSPPNRSVRRNDFIRAIGAISLIGAIASCQTGFADAGTLDVIQRLSLGSKVEPLTAAFRSGDHSLIVAGVNGPVRQWSRPTENAKKFVDWTPPKDPLVGIPEGLASVEPLGADVVLVATTTGTVSMVNLATKASLFSRKLTPYGASNRAIASVDGRRLAYAGRVYDVPTGREMGNPSPVDRDSVLALSRDGKVLVNAGYRLPRIVLREVGTGEVREWTAPDSIVAGGLSPAGDLLATVLKSGRVVLWRLANGKPIADWSGASGGRWLRFSGDGGRVTVGDDEGISCYDVRTTERLFRGKVEGGAVYVFGGEADIVTAGSWDGVIYLWDVRRRALIAHKKVSAAGPIKAVALDVVGSVVAVADLAGEVSLWHWR